LGVNGHDVAASSDGEQVARLAQLGHRFDELSGLLVSAQVGPPDPDRVVRYVARAVPHSQHCGLTLVQGSQPVTLSASSGLARTVDSIQYETREGPCLEAVEGHDVTQVADLAVDEQWPMFARRCVAETNVRSMFSLRLFLSTDARAALNFYADRPSAFDDLDVGVGAMFAPLAALAVQSAVREREIEHLHTALQSSRHIGVAIGILMARRLVSYDQAFAQLVNASQHLNVKLRDIAAEVAETGRLPEMPARPQKRPRS
jgi:ANTAR domain/GAF domain